MNNRQRDILEWLDKSARENPEGDLAESIEKSIEKIQEFATTDDLLRQLIDRYAASSSEHIVYALSSCLKQRNWEIDPQLGAELALRCLELCSAEQSYWTSHMLCSMVLNSPDLEKVQGSMLKKLVFMLDSACDGPEIYLSCETLINLLYRVLPHGFLGHSVAPDEKNSLITRMKSCGQRLREHGSHPDYLEELETVTRMLNQGAER
jgi:hypothetical protein